MKCNCMMKCYNKLSVQSLDSDLDSQSPTSVDVESAPTHITQLDSELHLQHSTSVLTTQASLLYTPNLILNLIATSYFSEKNPTYHTYPNLISNLIETGNFSEKSESVTRTRHTRPTPNLISNLISTSNFSEMSLQHLTDPNFILNLIETGNFSEKSESVTRTRHTRPTPNLISNLISTSNFSEKNQTYLIYPNLIPNLIATSNFSAGRSPPHKHRTNKKPLHINK